MTPDAGHSDTAATGQGEPALLRLPRANVGPIPFRVATLDGAVDAVLSAAGMDVGVPVHFANAYTVALADTDPDYLALFTAADAAVFSDGVPVVWAGRRTHPHLASNWQRVYGPDVMSAVLTASATQGPNHYLLGGSTQTLALLQQRITEKWPSARIVGAESPPFRRLTEAETRAQDHRIRASGAQIVWVGLGTPKQDWEVARLARELPVVAMAVGAAFDFLAGVKPQAPVWMQRSGTEWLYRFASEPRRLAKRYLWGNPRFVYAAVRDRPRRTRVD